MTQSKRGRKKSTDSVSPQRRNLKRLNQKEEKSEFSENESKKSKSPVRLLKIEVDQNIEEDMMSEGEFLRMMEQQTQTTQKIVQQKDKPQEAKLNLVNDHKKPFNKLKFVITGNFKVTPDWELIAKLIDRMGGHVVSQVSGVTNFLLTGYILEDGWPVDQSLKYKNAVNKGTKMMNEQELDNELRIITGKSLEELLNETHQQVFTEKKQEQKAVYNSLKEKTLKKLDDVNCLWVDKYAPQGSKQIIGNQSLIDKIRDWIKNWSTHNNEGKIRSKEKSRCLLLSGPPGIGKTTTIKLLCQELNINLLVQNASDSWNKSQIKTFMGSFEQNQSLERFFVKQQTGTTQQKTLLLMDEIDGMSSDRGGLTELIQQIKKTHQPIICICNNRENPQVKTLSQYCFDVKFKQPTTEQIFPLVEFILQQEGAEKLWQNTDKSSLVSIIQSSQFDIRQIIGQLQIWAQSMAQQNNDFKSIQKQTQKDMDMSMNIFDASKKLLNSKMESLNNLRNLQKLFFVDYGLIDFYIFENYLSRVAPGKDQLQKAYECLQNFQIGDQISNVLRSTQDWDLLPAFSWFSCIAPSVILPRHLDFPQFPILLGKMGTKKKNLRLKQELSAGYWTHGSQMNYQDTVLFTKALLIQINKLITLSKFEDLMELYDNYSLTPEKVEEHMPSLVGFYDPNGDSLKTNASNSKQFQKYYQKVKSDTKLTKATKAESPAETSEVSYQDEQEDISFDEFD